MPRRSMVRLIAVKEFSDLLRDRRTVMLILVLPALLYALFGAVGWLFVTRLLGTPATVAVLGAEHLPPPRDAPPLLAPGGQRFADGVDDDADAMPVSLKQLTGDPDELLRTKQADALLIVPPDFAAKFASSTEKPTLTLRFREGDDKGKLAGRRLAAVARAWGAEARKKRFVKAGLPADFDKVFVLDDPQADKPRAKKAADEARDAFAKVFPFILMMWLVAGAIQPAVDMTSGEKERGTMETLLISPAERSEIVYGKFAATSMFTFLSVIWNVLWLAAAGLFAERYLDGRVVNMPGMLGCLLLGLPIGALFSAAGVALGVFAKSTKEGQYYLMPMMLAAMPLALWSMAPGAEIGPGNFWVPVTGAMLLQQKLLAVSGDPVPWEYLAPVLLALAAWVALALAFAVWQFRREGVLFTEDGPAGGGVRGFFRGMAGPR